MSLGVAASVRRIHLKHFLPCTGHGQGPWAVQHGSCGADLEGGRASRGTDAAVRFDVLHALAGQAGALSSRLMDFGNYLNILAASDLVSAVQQMELKSSYDLEAVLDRHAGAPTLFPHAASHFCQFATRASRTPSGQDRISHGAL